MPPLLQGFWDGKMWILSVCWGELVEVSIPTAESLSHAISGAGDPGCSHSPEAMWNMRPTTLSVANFIVIPGNELTRWLLRAMPASASREEEWVSLLKLK